VYNKNKSRLLINSYDFVVILHTKTVAAIDVWNFTGSYKNPYNSNLHPNM